MGGAIGQSRIEISGIRCAGWQIGSDELTGTESNAYETGSDGHNRREWCASHRAAFAARSDGAPVEYIRCAA
jgi:hypothetical protein